MLPLKRGWKQTVEQQNASPQARPEADLRDEKRFDCRARSHKPFLKEACQEKILDMPLFAL